MVSFLLLFRYHPLLCSIYKFLPSLFLMVFSVLQTQLQVKQAFLFFTLQEPTEDI